MPTTAGTAGEHMSVPQSIDVHAHILSEETISLIAKAAPVVAPKLTPIDQEFALLEIAGTPYRPYPRSGEPKVNLTVSPEASLARLHYDTILHSTKALKFLVGSVGADHVMLGSDYPFDMGMMDCVRHVRSLDVPPAQRDSILAGRAKDLLGAASATARAGRRAKA